MEASEIARNSALSFARDWIAQHIDVGPFSCDDNGIYDGPIRKFKDDAAKAGFDEVQLECAVGPVPKYVSDAFQAAASAWRADQLLRLR